MLKNSIIAIQGTVIAQALGFLLTPALTRLYSPEAFGTFQLFSSTLMFVVVAASLRYEVALLSAANGGEERAVLRLCLVLNIICALLVLAITFALDSLRPSWLSVPSAFLYMLAAGALTSGLLQTVGYFLIREQALWLQAITKILQVLVFCLGGIAAAHAGATGMGLIVADILGRAVAVSLVVAWMVTRRAPIFVGVRLDQVWNSVSRYREYPKLAVPSGWLSGGVAVLAPLLMFAAFGEMELGQFALVERMVVAPAGLLGQAVAQAFNARLSGLVQRGDPARATFRRLLAVLLALALVPAAVIAMFGTWLFSTVFGPEWALAGKFAEIMSVVSLVSFVTAPVNMTLLIIGKPNLQFAWDVGRLLLMGLVWTTILLMAISPLAAIAMHAGALVATNLAFLWLADRSLDDRPIN